MTIDGLTAWLLALHVGFWSTFVARATGVLRPRASGADPISSNREQGPRSRGRIEVAHSLGFVPLYVGMLLGVPSRALWLRVLGSGLAILGLLLTVWALRHLRSWRVDARVPVGHELTASGPFQWIRHPIYTAFALLALGTALVCSTPLTWLACAWIWSLGGVRARIEERVLLEAFGDRYGAYMRRTGRFIPGLG